MFRKSMKKLVAGGLLAAFLLVPVATGLAAPFDDGIGKVKTSAGYADEGAMDIFGNLVNIVLGFMGVVVLVIVLVGGFKWITSGGAEEKIKDAQKLIAAGAVGLLIIASAYAISNFIITKVEDTGGINTTTSAIIVPNNLS